MTLTDPYSGFQGHNIFEKYLKNGAFYQMVIFPMTLMDPWPGFQGHGIFEVKYLKNGAL